METVIDKAPGKDGINKLSEKWRCTKGDSQKYGQKKIIIINMNEGRIKKKNDQEEMLL